MLAVGVLMGWKRKESMGYISGRRMDALWVTWMMNEGSWGTWAGVMRDEGR